jgi:hypothetical protein
MNEYVKYVGGGLILASLYGLVLLGKIDATVYYGIAMSALAGLGVHAAVTTPYSSSKDDDANPPPAGP